MCKFMQELLIKFGGSFIALNLIIATVYKYNWIQRNSLAEVLNRLYVFVFYTGRDTTIRGRVVCQVAAIDKNLSLLE